MQTLRETTNIVNRNVTPFVFQTYSINDQTEVTANRIIRKILVARSNNETIQVLSSNPLDGSAVPSLNDLGYATKPKINDAGTAFVGSPRWYPYLQNQKPTLTGADQKEQNSEPDNLITHAPIALHGLFPYPISRFASFKRTSASEGTQQQWELDFQPGNIVNNTYIIQYAWRHYAEATADSSPGGNSGPLAGFQLTVDGSTHAARVTSLRDKLKEFKIEDDEGNITSLFTSVTDNRPGTVSATSNITITLTVRPRYRVDAIIIRNDNSGAGSFAGGSVQQPVINYSTDPATFSSDIIPSVGTEFVAPNGQFKEMRSILRYEGMKNPETRFDPDVNSEFFVNPNGSYDTFDFTIEPSGLGDPHSTTFPVAVRDNYLNNINFRPDGTYELRFKVFVEVGSQFHSDMATLI